ncbi:MAG: endo-1,4-beta-xylanase [Pyrinomonadaceae bacterium]
MMRQGGQNLRVNPLRLLGCGLFALIVLSISCKSLTTAASETDRNARNQTALATARENINKYRKGDARIKVVDNAGRPVSNARLEVRQVSHAFKFGCYLKIDDLEPTKLAAYERHFKTLFNYAVVGNYWSNIEKKRGAENWSWYDRETQLSKDLGMRTQAAPVLWGTNKYGSPAWLPNGRDELLYVLQQRVKNAVTRADGVSDIEIVNEPLSKKPDVIAGAISGDYIAQAFQWARASAPYKRLLINESGIFGSVARHNYNADKYFALVDGLIKKDVPVDIIGIQAHAIGQWYEPADVAHQLERYSSLGRPVQITEFSVQTFDYDDKKTPQPISGSYRSGTWDAEKQAEFYREFYTVAFGSPAVEGITTWGLDDERAWLPGIGVIDKNVEPKPAYRELERLINGEWKTSLSGGTDAGGIYTVNGFFGEYEVTAEVRGKQTLTRFTLAKDGPNAWTVTVGN